MRKDSLLFLIAGFAVGFGIFYFWTKNREPQIVSATFARLELPTAQSQQPMVSPDASRPPVNMAEVQALQDKIRQNPNDYDSLVALGNIHFDQRNYSQAVDLYKTALTIRDDIDVRTDLGTMLFYSDRFDEAMTELNKVLAVNPTHGQALFNLAVVQLHGKKDSQAALKTWEKLLATNPNFPQRAMVEEQVKALKESLK
jgi:cytochrome c-type biogenesis protein CcmH/NrfG